ncbi:MAG TPA: hypothetical protein VGK33_20090 [Chloroflexota bacterium]
MRRQLLQANVGEGVEALLDARKPQQLAIDDDRQADLLLSAQQIADGPLAASARTVRDLCQMARAQVPPAPLEPGLVLAAEPERARVAAELSVVPERAAELSVVPERAAELSVVPERAAELSVVPERAAMWLSAVPERAAAWRSAAPDPPVAWRWAVPLRASLYQSAPRWASQSQRQ